VNIFHNLAQSDYEQLVFLQNVRCGLQAFLVIHDTTRGPALGGVRLADYPSENLALGEALRLARIMSLKAALAGLPCGGGKAVINSKHLKDRKEAFQLLARVVDSFGGRYYTTGERGTTPEDVEVMRDQSRWVCAESDDGVDSLSEASAYGLLVAIRATSAHVLQKVDVAGMHVAVQGAGQAGSAVAEVLTKAGLRVTIADINPVRAQEVADRTGASVVPSNQIFGVDCDVFAPCSGGGVINPSTIPTLKAKMVCGLANAQLRDEQIDAGILRGRGITMVPDYIASAGAMIQGAFQLLEGRRNSHDEIEDRITASVTEVLRLADDRKLPPTRIADELALSRLKSNKGPDDLYWGTSSS